LQAVWNGRIVSESTLISHINAVRTAIGDTGKDQRLIRTVSRRGLRFVGEIEEQELPANKPIAMTDSPTERLMPVLVLPDSPSIAVLPFRNLGGDVEQDYFADGIVEDIITALSRIRWLFVIARNSSFTYKGKTVDEKQVGRELGVRYVVEGSVRQSEKRIRITGQLVDASTGTHLWADRFEGKLDDIFELQDQIATGIVGAIASQLERAEIERARRKPTGNLSAYDTYLRAMPHLHRGTREAIDGAMPLQSLGPGDVPDAGGHGAVASVSRALRHGGIMGRTIFPGSADLFGCGCRHRGKSRACWSNAAGADGD
jgi:TolB-like protein